METASPQAVQAASKHAKVTRNSSKNGIEISFGNECNFKCGYCHPKASSSYYKEIEQFGPYTTVKNHRNDINWFKIYHKEEENPYVDAWWAWWPELYPNLHTFRITGGEPLMSGETWKLLDWFKNNKGKSHTRLAINSNLGTDVDIDRLLSAVEGVTVDIYTSNESMNLQAEYIRDGLVFDDWANNVERLLDSGQLRGLHIMNTVNALCLESLDQFLECMVNWKIEYGRDAVNFTLNILRFPSFQSPLVLPAELRTKFRDRLADFMVRHKGYSYLHEHEINHLQRLIDYLDVVKTPHREAFELPRLRADFKNFYQQYDQRRGKDFKYTFPQLAEWYDTL